MSTYTFDPISDPSANEGTYVYGINGTNEIVGMYVLNHADYGFLENNGVYTTLADPLANDNSTSANGINASGQISGTYLGSDGHYNGYHGFLYSNGTWTTLNDPSAANQTDAQGTNNSGDVVGNYYNAFYHGFLYNAGSWTTLDDPIAVTEGGNTYAYGINNAAKVVAIIPTPATIHTVLLRVAEFGRRLTTPRRARMAQHLRSASIMKT